MFSNIISWLFPGLAPTSMTTVGQAQDTVTYRTPKDASFIINRHLIALSSTRPPRDASPTYHYDLFSCLRLRLVQAEAEVSTKMRWKKVKAGFLPRRSPATTQIFSLTFALVQVDQSRSKAHIAITTKDTVGVPINVTNTVKPAVTTGEAEEVSTSDIDLTASKSYSDDSDIACEKWFRNIDEDYPDDSSDSAADTDGCVSPAMSPTLSPAVVSRVKGYYKRSNRPFYLGPQRALYSSANVDHIPNEEPPSPQINSAKKVEQVDELHPSEHEPCDTLLGVEHAIGHDDGVDVKHNVHHDLDAGEDCSGAHTQPENSSDGTSPPSTGSDHDGTPESVTLYSDDDKVKSDGLHADGEADEPNDEPKTDELNEELTELQTAPGPVVSGTRVVLPPFIPPPFQDEDEDGDIWQAAFDELSADDVKSGTATATAVLDSVQDSDQMSHSAAFLDIIDRPRSPPATVLSTFDDSDNESDTQSIPRFRPRSASDPLPRPSSSLYSVPATWSWTTDDLDSGIWSDDSESDALSSFSEPTMCPETEYPLPTLMPTSGNLAHHSFHQPSPTCTGFVPSLHSIDEIEETSMVEKGEAEDLAEPENAYENVQDERRLASYEWEGRLGPVSRDTDIRKFNEYFHWQRGRHLEDHEGTTPGFPKAVWDRHGSTRLWQAWSVEE